MSISRLISSANCPHSLACAGSSGGAALPRATPLPPILAQIAPAQAEALIDQPLTKLLNKPKHRARRRPVRARFAPLVGLCRHAGSGSSIGSMRFDPSSSRARRPSNVSWVPPFDTPSGNFSHCSGPVNPIANRPGVPLDGSRQSRGRARPLDHEPSFLKPCSLSDSGPPRRSPRRRRPSLSPIAGAAPGRRRYRECFSG